MPTPISPTCRRASLLLAVLLATSGSCHAGGSAVDQVTAVYRQIAWQAVLETGGGGTGLLDQPAERLRQIFDPALAALVLRQQRCQAKGQGLCALDFDPFWDSQDPVGTTVALTPGKRAGEVNVVLRTAGGTPRRLSLQLVQAVGGWRIADIRFGGQRPSLKALLAQNP